MKKYFGKYGNCYLGAGKVDEAGRSFMRMISDFEPSRIRGPQVPVPVETYRYEFSCL